MHENHTYTNLRKHAIADINKVNTMFESLQMFSNWNFIHKQHANMYIIFASKVTNLFECKIMNVVFVCVFYEYNMNI